MSKVEEKTTKVAKKIGFAKKIMLMVAFPAVVLGIVLAIFTAIESNFVLKQNFSEEVLSLSKSYGTAVESRISRLDDSFNLVIMDPDVVDTNLSLDVRKQILAEAAEMTILNDFSIAYADGTTYNDTDISEREYFQYAMQNKTSYISSPVVRLTDNSITIMMGQYFTANGSDYLAYGGLDVDVFNDVVEDIDFEEGSVSFLLDKNGQVISTSSEELIPLMTELSSDSLDKEYSGIAGLLDTFLSHTSGTSSAVFNGQKYLFGYVPINGNEDWVIVVGTPYTPITRSILITIVCFVALMLVCLLVMLPLTLRTVRVICKPIVETSERLQQFAEGNVSAPAPKCSSGDEIQKMTDSLADMITTIGDYINDIRNILSSIANGDLTVKPQADYSGEFSEIKSSMNLILTSLNKTLTEVGRSASEVREGAGQLADGSTSLSQNAIQQASTVDEITSTVMDIAKKTEENNDNVKKALASSQAANDKAQDSAECMNDLLKAIAEIEDSSREIGNIINVIDDIAFQTNILALNAAIEAARAGEAGKGFAVVADEVRNLASKSSQATMQTGQLINKSIESVKNGVELAEKTSASLEEIVQGVAEVSAAMNEISIASETQAVAVEQVSEGIGNVNAAIHNTTATAEQSAAASEELSALAVSLTDAVSRFRCE